MHDFMPWHGFAGGLLIGLSAAILLLVSGRIAGISGIIESTLAPSSRSLPWSIAFLAGLPFGALIVLAVAPQLVPKVELAPSWPVVAAVGLLVGFGSRLGGGCTSGHGVCGLPRLSLRSLVATAIFMATGALTVFLARHVL